MLERHAKYLVLTLWAVLAPALAAARLTMPPGADDSFGIEFTLDVPGPAPGGSVMEIPEALNVKITGEGDRQRLIAELWLVDSVFTSETRRRPMSVAAWYPGGEHRIGLYYTGARWMMYVDGRLADKDFPVGTPAASEKPVTVDDGYVGDVSLNCPLPPAPAEEHFTGAQYWTPPYDNAWVGDVTAMWHDGRYHLFYLLDRRGHQSKFGAGGHYFEHISTADLTDWTVHPAPVEIEEQWETFGTGTPFVSDGRLCLAYGLHTSRIVAPERLVTSKTGPDGRTSVFSYDTVPQGFYTSGATYAVSGDGGHTFSKTRRIIHFCENPCIYTNDDSTLTMIASYYAKGTWTSPSLEEGWECTDADFPPGGDCTFPFAFGGRQYIAGGFSGMWEKDGDSYRDITAAHADCYNGLSVPAFTTLPDGRTLMAGWVKTRGWGGLLAIHQVVPDGPDGALGSAWVDELIPDLPRVRPAKEGTFDTPRSFICEFEAVPQAPGHGELHIALGDNDFWSLILDDDIARFSDSPESSQAVLANGGDVAGARNYAVKTGCTASGRIPVRMTVKTDPKWEGTLADVEIDGRRTMLSFRPGLTVDSVKIIAKNIEIK